MKVTICLGESKTQISLLCEGINTKAHTIIIYGNLEIRAIFKPLANGSSSKRKKIMEGILGHQEGRRKNRTEIQGHTTDDPILCDFINSI